MKVEFYKHQLDDRAKRAVCEVLDTPFLTSGPVTRAFEERARQYFGVNSFRSSSSCTSAMFLALKGWGIGPGDEVLVPAMTFIATANVVLHAGATPVLVDVDSNTGLIDTSQLDRHISIRTKAIIPVHLYGAMCDVAVLRKIADVHSLKILEDCAHCFEGSRNGIRPGNLGDAAAFSFYATKNIASGEGGGLATNDAQLAEKFETMRQHGMSKSAHDRYSGVFRHWDMIELGYKENMFDIQAALLMTQFEDIDQKISRREEISRYYEAEFARAGIDFPIVPDGVKSARHLFTVWAKNGNRDAVIQSMIGKNVGVAVNYRALHQTTFYEKLLSLAPQALPVATRIGNETLTIPLYPTLSDAEVEYVARSVIQSFEECCAI
jgi:dTDP-4-amino-4,6-dideoxygalactose transaminase